MTNPLNVPISLHQPQLILRSKAEIPTSPTRNTPASTSPTEFSRNATLRRGSAEPMAYDCTCQASVVELEAHQTTALVFKLFPLQIGVFSVHAISFLLQGKLNCVREFPGSSYSTVLFNLCRFLCCFGAL